MTAAGVGVARVNVWLWDAGERFAGVSDDKEAAKEAAAGCLGRGDAARVELAVVVLGWPSRYARTGEGWRSVRPWRGPMEWVQLAGGRRSAS